MKNKKIFWIVVLTVSSVLTTISCTKNEIVLKSEIGGFPLSFCVSTEKILELKSSVANKPEGCGVDQFTLSSTDGSQTIRMTLFETSDSGTKAEQSSATPLNSFTVAGYEGNDQWFPRTGSPVSVTPGQKFSDYVWTSPSKLSFFAYANLKAGMNASISSSGVSLICSNYDVADTSLKDVLLGVYSGYGDYSGTASLKFFHPMTEVVFKQGEFELKSVALEGVAASASAILNETNDYGKFNWTVSSTKTVCQETGGNVKFELIPQDFPSAPVHVDFVITIDGKDTHFTGDFTNGRWEAGHIYSYVLTSNAHYTGERCVINGHDAVVIKDKDNDIYRKWATVNIGATAPNEAGWYFSWGNVIGYEHKSGRWYEANTVGKKLFKFDYSHYDNTPGSLLLYDIPTIENYDAAQSEWGGSWRIPSINDYNSLKESTYFQKDDTDNGYYVYVPNPEADAGKCNNGEGSYSKSDALLFFPCAGYGKQDEITYAGEGHYMTSTFNSNSRYYDFTLSGSHCSTWYQERYIGSNIRPVSY